MKLRYFTLACAAAFMTAAQAHTVLLNEDFSGDWRENSFPTVIEGDNLPP